MREEGGRGAGKGKTQGKEKTREGITQNGGTTATLTVQRFLTFVDGPRVCAVEIRLQHSPAVKELTRATQRLGGEGPHLHVSLAPSLFLTAAQLDRLWSVPGAEAQMNTWNALSLQETHLRGTEVWQICLTKQRTRVEVFSCSVNSSSGNKSSLTTALRIRPWHKAVLCEPSPATRSHVWLQSGVTKFWEGVCSPTPQRNNSNLHLHLNCRHCRSPPAGPLWSPSVLIPGRDPGRQPHWPRGSRQGSRVTYQRAWMGKPPQGPRLEQGRNFTCQGPLYRRQGLAICFVLLHWHPQEEKYSNYNACTLALTCFSKMLWNTPMGTDCWRAEKVEGVAFTRHGILLCSH